MRTYSYASRSGRYKPSFGRLSGDLLGELAELAAYEQHPLENGQPGHRREQVDRPLQPSPGSEEEADGDDDDPFDSGAEADVTAQSERFRPGARVRDEERPDDCGEGRHERDLVRVEHEGQPDGRQDRRLA